MLAKAGPGIRFNEHRRRDCVPARLQAGARRHRLEAEGFALSLGAARPTGKMKNPTDEAVRREAEEDWGR